MITSSLVRRARKLAHSSSVHLIQSSRKQRNVVQVFGVDLGRIASSSHRKCMIENIYCWHPMLCGPLRMNQSKASNDRCTNPLSPCSSVLGVLSYGWKIRLAIVSLSLLSHASRNWQEWPHSHLAFCPVVVRRKRFALWLGNNGNSMLIFSDSYLSLLFLLTFLENFYCFLLIVKIGIVFPLSFNGVIKSVFVRND